MKILGKKNNRRWTLTEEMFFSLFLTGTLIEFSQVGAGFVDGLVISRFLGSEAMAAEGIVHPIYSVLGVISGLLAVGMQVHCSQEIGRGNRREFSRFFSVTVYVGAGFSLLTMLLILLFAKPFCALLGASGNAADLLDSSAKYLVGIGIGIPPLIMTAILAPAFQLDSGRKTIQTGALIETVVNILLDLWAVKMGWGIFGVGLATAVASYTNLLFQCTHFLKKDRMLHFVKPDVPAKEFFRMLSNGGEKAIKRLANIIRPVILNTIIISYGGTAAMSALSVRNNFSNFTEIFGAGVASAVSLLVSLYYGEINEEAIDEVASYSHRLIFIFSGAVCALLLAFARPIARLYVTEDGEILNMVVFAMRMLAIQSILQALIARRIKYLQAIRRKFNMNLLIFSTQLVFVLLSAFVLGKVFGVYGILAGYTVSDALTLIAVLVFYQVKSRKMRPNGTDFHNLPEEFYLHPGDMISLDIRNKEEVALASEQITLFCKGHKVDRKTSYYASLCFEELADNIVEYGFPQSNSSDPMIDLRVVITGNIFVLRMRDDCPLYDVTEHFALANAEDADLTKNIGVRIVSRLASDISYLSAFETNNIIIRFELKAAVS